MSVLKRANKLFRLGKLEAALEVYKEALTLKSNDPEVRRFIGDIELRLQNTPGALVQYRWIADYYGKEGMLARALAMLKRISQMAPDDLGSLQKMADLCAQNGLDGEAMRFYQDVAEKFKQRGNLEKVRHIYKKILALRADDVETRLLLADSYFEDGQEDKGAEETLAAARILLNKNDHAGVEELLVKKVAKTKNPRLIEITVNFYTRRGKEDKALKFLEDLGLPVFKSVKLLKIMGNLYLKKNQTGDAEIIFSKIAEIDPGQTDVILDLGKVYLRQKQYDRAYNLFLPFIEQNLLEQKNEDACALLRFIISANDTYLPAYKKLAGIFKQSGQTNSLIAVYESMVAIYEQKGMNEELKQILEELIGLSDKPAAYKEQLAALNRTTPAAAPPPQPEAPEASPAPPAPALEFDVDDDLSLQEEIMDGIMDEPQYDEDEDTAERRAPLIEPETSKEKTRDAREANNSIDAPAAPFPPDEIPDIPALEEDSDSDESIGSILQEISGFESGYDSDEDLLKGNDLFLEQLYLEIEKNVQAEQEAIKKFSPRKKSPPPNG
jgi:tetratricopeptide (TPR) repeat protein